MKDIVLITKQRYIKSLNTHHPPSIDEVTKDVTIIQLNNLELDRICDLSMFKGAQKAYFADNQITQVEPQDNDFLEDIDFSHNQLTEIPNMGGQYTFTINLMDNKLSQIRLVKPMPNLCVLNLSNQPGDVFSKDFADSVRQFAPRLQAINIDNTNSVDLSMMQGIASLKQISAKSNLIEQLADVIPYLPKSLVSIDLSNNVVLKKRGIFETICYKCPQLKKYNGDMFTEQQVKFAAMKGSKMK